MPFSLNPSSPTLSPALHPYPHAALDDSLPNPLPKDSFHTSSFIPVCVCPSAPRLPPLRRIFKGGDYVPGVGCRIPSMSLQSSAPLSSLIRFPQLVRRIRLRYSGRTTSPPAPHGLDEGVKTTGIIIKALCLLAEDQPVWSQLSLCWSLLVYF